MELQPFGIEVITVQPGGVSQFSATAAKRFHPSDASLYAAVTDAIAARLGASQARATPTEVFARKMAEAVLAATPQAVVRIGHYSLLLPFLKRWLPTRALDRVLSRRLSWIGFCSAYSGQELSLKWSGKSPGSQSHTYSLWADIDPKFAVVYRSILERSCELINTTWDVGANG